MSENFAQEPAPPPHGKKKKKTDKPQKLWEQKWFAPVAAILVTSGILIYFASMGANTVNKGNEIIDDARRIHYSLNEDSKSEVFKALDEVIFQTYRRTHPLGEAWKDLVDWTSFRATLGTSGENAEMKTLEDLILPELTWAQAKLLSVESTSDTSKARVKFERTSAGGKKEVVTFYYIRHEDLWKVFSVDGLDL